MFSRIHSLASCLIILVVLLFAGSAGAQDASPRCEAAMDRAAGHYSQCLLSADASYARHGNPTKLANRQARCETRFDRRAARAINRHGEDECASADLVTAMADRTVSYAAGIATEASGAPSPSYLFVQNGTGGTLTESILTLTGVNDETGYFSDRPYREAGQISTEGFLRHWYGGENSFAADPPNAAFTCTVDGEAVNLVVELTRPLLVGDELSYLVQGIGDGDLPTDATCDQTASLVIDNDDAALECWKKAREKYPPIKEMTDAQYLEWDKAYFECFPCKHGSSLVGLPEARICKDLKTDCKVDSDCPTGQTCHTWSRAGALMCVCPDGGLPGFGDTADCGGPGEIHASDFQ